MNENETLKHNWTPISIPRKPTKRLKLSTKQCLWFAVIIISILILLLIWLCILLTAKHTECSKTMCVSRECLKIASTILERIDQSVDPCENFYEFACGNFIKSTFIPDDYYAKNLLQEMQEGMFVEIKNYLESPIEKDDEHEIQQIKMLYLSCINETDEDIISNSSVESLFDLIIELTGSEWPILTNDQELTFDEMSLEHQLALLYLHQVQPFFQVYVTSNKNISIYALHILPGTTVMEQYNFGIPKHFDNLTKSQIDLYLNFQKVIVKAFMELKEDNDFYENKDRINRELEQMFLFEIDLVNITKEITMENCNRNESNEYDELCEGRSNQNLFINISIDDMEKEFPNVKWSTFFEYISHEANVTVTHALIHSKEYFRSLLVLLETHSRRTLNNYLGWSVIVKYMPYLGQQFRHLSSEFQDKILVTETDMGESNSGFKYYQSKWKQCVFISCDGLKIPAITLYFKHQKENIRKISEKIETLILEMKNTFLNIIDKQKWIDTVEIKEILKNRVQTIRSKIGVPEHVLNRTLIDQMYSQLEIDQSKQLISNIFKINRHETIIDVRKLNQQTKISEDWLFQPLDANAFYDSSVNHIIIPVGIMRKPLIYLNIPKYLELAFFGIVVGHEIAHSIDMSSRKFLAEKSPIFVNSTFNRTYKHKAQCFADKYSNYRVDEINQNLNGNNTLDENICDFASFQQVYSLYQALNDSDKTPLPGLDQFTINQVFYLQYAQLWCESATKDGHMKSLQDIHSPGKFRANGVLMNSVSFSREFNCPTNSKMHPINKCDLWAHE